MFRKIVHYFTHAPAREKIFVLAIFGCSFFVSLDYGIIRPASTSIFIEMYGAQYVPHAWLASVPLNFFLISMYNFFLPRWGNRKTFICFAILIIGVQGFAGFYCNRFYWLSFIQNIFKDVYILLIYKQIWSLIHSTISKENAKFLYGWMYGFGGIGSMVGGIITSCLAVRFSSQKLFLASLPSYIFLIIFYSIAHRNSGITSKQIKESLINKPKPSEGFSLIRKSSVLTAIMLFVILFQVMVSLTTYQFNLSLEEHIANVDLRTEYTGKLFTVIHVFMTLFQVLGSYFLIEKLGEKKSHCLIPIILTINSLIFMILPSLFMASYSFVFIKFLEFSFFGIIIEILYIPLSLDEKFRAKAVIDVFIRRSAKALGAVILLLIALIQTVHHRFLIGLMVLPIMISWISIVRSFFKETSNPLKPESQL